MTLADEAAADRVCSDTHVLDGRQVSVHSPFGRTGTGVWERHGGVPLPFLGDLGLFCSWMPSGQYLRSISPAAKRSLLGALRQKPLRVSVS